MPKNIVATPAAVVAVDRLTLQADDARGEGGIGVAAQDRFLTCCYHCVCFSEE